jgi:hypothetical protein
MIGRNVLRVGALASALVVVLGAQGTVSTQGFGYPPGQLTVRAATTGGALGEFDPTGAINPASLMNWGVPGGYLQYSPERRATSVNGTSTSTTVARFPVFAIGLPVGQKYSFGISGSTLLERNYSLTTSARQLIRADSVTTTSAITARGGMSDVQLGGAMQVAKWLRVGVAVHAITGENRLNTIRTIRADTVARIDTVSYGTITETSTATFAGRALSAGVEIMPNVHFSLAASGRVGFRLSAELTDSTGRRAEVPNRASLSARYEIGGTTIAARYNWDGWSAMRGLGAESGGVFDSKEVGGGIELPGPRVPGGQVLMRLGARARDLPF